MGTTAAMLKKNLSAACNLTTSTQAQAGENASKTKTQQVFLFLPFCFRDCRPEKRCDWLVSSQVKGHEMSSLSCPVKELTKKPRPLSSHMI